MLAGDALYIDIHCYEFLSRYADVYLQKKSLSAVSVGFDNALIRSNGLCLFQLQIWFVHLLVIVANFILLSAAFDANR